jgi:pyridoxal phosphate-dependent aminotransferase EpsN
MTRPTADKRIYMSSPHLSGRELEYVAEAFATNWVAPLGPHVDAFESEFANRVGMKHALALSSGTAALHLALRVLGIKPGDEVMCATLTFAASAYPIVYEGARPVFVDSERRSWGLDPALLAEELARLARVNRLPRAVIVVDLFGQCADLEPIAEACGRYDIPLIEDAAEALGATYRGRPAGAFGLLSAFSFNGNKIITTSGGGMLVTSDPGLAHHARVLSQQARDPVPHYEHSQIGFNYRMSNVLAGIGRAQLAVLDERVEARRRVFEVYRDALADEPGITFMPEADFGRATRWLTAMLVDPQKFGATRDDIRLHLEARNIEARPTWKPMHRQPVFADCRAVGGAVADAIFEQGLCVPSGSNLTPEDLSRVVEAFRSVPRRRGA